MKTVKTVLAAVILASVPTLSLAMCNWDKHETAMSCAEGMVLDPVSGTCVSSASS